VALAKHETDESLHKMLELDVKFLPPMVEMKARERGGWMLVKMTILLQISGQVRRKP